MLRVGVGLVAWLAVTGTARAQQPPSSVLSPVRITAWSAPDECPEPDALLSAIAEEFEAAPPTELSELSVAVVIVKRAERFTLRLSVTGRGDLVREVEGDSCEAVITAAALTLAMVVEVADDAGAPPIEVEPPPSPGPEAPPTRVVFTQARRAVRGAVRVGWGTELGLMPGFSSSIVTGAGLQLRSWRFDFGVAYWLERSTDEPGPSASISALVVPLRVCRRITSFLHISPCVGAEVGAFRARGTDLQQTREDSALFLAPHLGIAAGQRIAGPWWLRVFVGGAALLRRPRFTVLPDRELFVPSRLSARFVLASEVFF